MCAGEVVPASDEDLSELLRAVPRPLPPADAGVGPLGQDELLGLISRFEGDRLTRVLLADSTRLGPLSFLEQRVAPLVRAAGEEWAAGRLGVPHEHFLSERVGDVLRSLRLPFEARAEGPLAILGSLPGEEHALGLQMAALTLAAAGWRVLFLGPEVPPRQMVALARQQGAAAVGISVSRATGGAATRGAIRRMRAALPRRTVVLVGGEGAPAPDSGISVFPDLRSLDAWAQARSPKRGR